VGKGSGRKNTKAVTVVAAQKNSGRRYILKSLNKFVKQVICFFETDLFATKVMALYLISAYQMGFMV